jgi:dTMP kinase
MALFFASRCIWLDTLVKPAVNNGKIVLSDRYDSSTNAYQGWAEGGNKKTIEKFSEVVSDGFKPDAIILLRVSEDTAIKRKSKNTEGDPFDNEDINYFRKLVVGYDDMSKNKWRIKLVYC